ncbi:MAG TPA: hypothetical protein GXZ90_09170 [Clostridiales bacterium]|nr:hypothetical protein [Clostridiales bacterium]
MQMMDLTERFPEGMNGVDMLYPEENYDTLDGHDEILDLDELEDMKKEIMKKYEVNYKVADLVHQVRSGNINIDNISDNKNKIIVAGIISLEERERTRHIKMTEEDLPF